MKTHLNMIEPKKINLVLNPNHEHLITDYNSKSVSSKKESLFAS